MIEKPDPSDFVLWRRAACTQWLLEQLEIRFGHAQDWYTARSWEENHRWRGHQEIVDFVHRET